MHSRRLTGHRGRERLYRSLLHTCWVTKDNTTEAKAKAIRGVAEKILFGEEGDLHAGVRRCLSFTVEDYDKCLMSLPNAMPNVRAATPDGETGRQTW